MDNLYCSWRANESAIQPGVMQLEPTWPYQVLKSMKDQDCDNNGQHCKCFKICNVKVLLHTNTEPIDPITKLSVCKTKASHAGVNSHRLRRRLLPLSPFSVPSPPPACSVPPTPVAAAIGVTAVIVASDEVCHPEGKVRIGGVVR